jgi:hypothetical protein
MRIWQSLRVKPVAEIPLMALHRRLGMDDEQSGSYYRPEVCSESGKLPDNLLSQIGRDGLVRIVLGKSAYRQQFVDRRILRYVVGNPVPNIYPAEPRISW